MALIVQKYGGTSVQDPERIRKVAERVKRTVEAGHQLVVVVSARGGVTNEMDMLLSVGEQETIALTAIALHALGQPAVSRTGPQAGFRTDSVHTKARIIEITGGDILARLAEGKVVIVAGFQGLSHTGEIVTLGRGGSDLSAIALAAALKAHVCQIYTDVDGVYTADPRIVPSARKISEISYEEMLELASLGSKVMQARAVEFAQKFNVPFEVRSSMNENPGTLVKAEVPSMEDVVVSGVAIDKNQARLTVSDIPDQPGVAATVFAALAEAAITVDMIVQNVARGGTANLTFTVGLDDLPKAQAVVGQAILRYGAGSITHTGNIAKLSAVGIGMRTHAGVAAKMFSLLAQAGINIQMITTSEIKISVAIDLADANRGAQIIHDGFGLGDPR